MTIFYLLFLLAEILLSSVLLAGTVQMNIAYSLFIFLIVTASLVTIEMRMERECIEKKCDYRGALAYMPNRARVFAFFVLVALGLPISAIFWNNFIIISSLFRFSFIIGIMVMASIALISVSMLYELYMMRDLKSHIENEHDITDISKEAMLFFAGITVIVILSFFNPLWFVL
jgi:NADH:ubiquinone oxidoreductase subunit 4 (subunit M)